MTTPVPHEEGTPDLVEAVARALWEWSEQVRPNDAYGWFNLFDEDKGLWREQAQVAIRAAGLERVTRERDEARAQPLSVEIQAFVWHSPDGDMVLHPAEVDVLIASEAGDTP